MEACQGAVHGQPVRLRGGQVIHYLGEHSQDKVGLVVLVVHQKLDLMGKEDTLQNGSTCSVST